MVGNRSRHVSRKRKLMAHPKLPDDIIPEILINLSAKALMRFKSVSKSWRALISDPYFANSKLQRDKTKTNKPPPRTLLLQRIPWSRRMCFHMIEHNKKGSCIFKFLFQKDLRGVRSINFVHATFVPRPLHCDGLVLLPTAKCIQVCNPATRQVVALPPTRNPDTFFKASPWFDRLGFGFDRTTRKYKVVRFFYRAYDHQTFSLGLEVLTLGGETPPRWREIVEDPPYLIQPKDPVASARGCICCKIDNRFGDPFPFPSWCSRAILRFDLSSEKFTTIRSPPCFSESQEFAEQAQLRELWDNLCCIRSLLDIANGGMLFEIWMTSDELQWTLAHTVSLHNSPRPFVPIAIDERRLLLILESCRMYYYNFDDRAGLKKHPRLRLYMDYYNHQTGTTQRKLYNHDISRWNLPRMHDVSRWQHPDMHGAVETKFYIESICYQATCYFESIVPLQDS